MKTILEIYHEVGKFPFLIRHKHYPEVDLVLNRSKNKYSEQDRQFAIKSPSNNIYYLYGTGNAFYTLLSKNEHAFYGIRI